MLAHCSLFSVALIVTQHSHFLFRFASLRSLSAISSTVSANLDLFGEKYSRVFSWSLFLRSINTETLNLMYKLIRDWSIPISSIQSVPTQYQYPILKSMGIATCLVVPSEPATAYTLHGQQKALHCPSRYVEISCLEQLFVKSFEVLSLFERNHWPITILS